MGLEHIWTGIKRERGSDRPAAEDFQSLAKAGISTVPAEAMLARMLEKVDELCADRDRLVGKERLSRPTYASGKAPTDRRPAGDIDNLRKFTPPWTV